MNYYYAKQGIGWFLVIFGVVLILLVLLTSYNIFTGRENPYEVFKIEEKEASVKTPGGGLEEQFEEIFQKALEDQLGEIISPESINLFFNLIAFSIFAFITIFAGSHISGVGVKILIKT